MDTVLREILELQAEETKCVDGKILQDLKNPRYTSGRLIKCGERIIMILEYKFNENDFSIQPFPEKLKKTTKPMEGPVHPTARMVPVETLDLTKTLGERISEAKELSIGMIIIHEEEIKEFCKNYLYVGGDTKTTKVVKKPKDWK